MAKRGGQRGERQVQLLVVVLKKKKKKKTSSSGAVGLSGKPTKTQGIGSLLTLHARGRSPLIIADLSP
jgi:hypothetical protein